MTKTNLKNYFWFAFLAGTLSVGLAACGGDDDDSGAGGSGGGGDDPVVVNPSKELSQQEQKAKLDQVGREFITHVQKKEVQNVMDVLRDLNKITQDDDNIEVNDWVEDVLEGIKRIYIGDTQVKEEYWDWTYITTQKNYQKVYYASQFYGNFTYDAKNEKWVYTKSDKGLSFNFQDASGRNCELALTKSGSETIVYVNDNTFHYDYIGSGNGVTNFEEEVDLNHVAIPEHVNLVLTQAGTVISQVAVNTDISSLNKENFDLSKDKFNASTTVTIQNLSVEVNNLVYKPNGTSSVSMNLKHNGTTIYSATASVTTEITGIYDQTEQEPDVKSIKDVNVSVDVLGKVQVKGTISDLMKMSEYLNTANEEYSKNESNFKSYVNQANDLMNLNLYYDKTSVKQAAVKLESFKTEGWYSSYWDCEPVLLFKDGTTYSTFDTFFNKTDFKQLIKAAENLFDSYDNEISNF